MADSHQKPAPAASPSCQQPGEQQDDQLHAARRFLDDDAVRDAPRDKQAAFLKSKGFEDADIEKLLDASRVESEPNDQPAGDNDVAASQNSSRPESKPELELEPENTREPKETRDAPVSLRTAGNRPPVVTYPEFLAKTPRPPPLVTTDGLLATSYAFAGLSTLVYGASRYLIAPMLETQTDARSELHGTAALRLQALVSKLEQTVSEIPPTTRPTPVADDSSEDAEDPTEMFHRDVGTQTSLPASPPATTGRNRTSAETESQRQAQRLSEAVTSLAGLDSQLRAQSEDLEDVRTLLDVFRDDLDAMTYSGQSRFVGGYDMYGSAKRVEPQDEIRRVRDNIRLVKGTLLSTRSFPASTR